MIPLFVGQDKDYGDLNFLNDLLDLDDDLLMKEWARTNEEGESFKRMQNDMSMQ